MENQNVINLLKVKYYSILEDCLELFSKLRFNCLITKDIETKFNCQIQHANRLLDEPSTPSTFAELHKLFKHIISTYGTHSLKNVFWIFFDEDDFLNSINLSKYHSDLLNLLGKHFHPLSVLDNRVVSTQIDSSIELQDTKSQTFFMRCFGIELHLGKEFIITGFLDNNYTSNGIIQNYPLINERIEQIIATYPINYLCLKDILLVKHETEFKKHVEISKKEVIKLKEKTIGSVVKEFLNLDLFHQRQVILNLLITDYQTKTLSNILNNSNSIYVYFLFDLLSSSNLLDSHHAFNSIQMTVRDSLPFCLQTEFNSCIINSKASMTMATNSQMDTNLTLEQQVMMLKVPVSVKEKAMIKIKDIKTKSEESSSKCKQYVEGLLRIPFGYYRSEDILKTRTNLMNQLEIIFIDNYDNKFYQTWTFHEIWNFIERFLFNIYENDIHDSNRLVKAINKYILKYNVAIPYKVSKSVLTKFQELEKTNVEFAPLLIKLDQTKQCALNNIKTTLQRIPEFMRQIESTFERAVYGHSKAKKALKQIVAQMIHGNLNSGYAFGFEGPPGVGKTSLAKYGLSECLKDEAGISRPFFMIPLGGDVNGSTLNGHHYTYLGSMWGSIVQILIDSKCMNPIILFDEVDKISKTESGKEIIGVLTHILDTTQNETFQDKYFNGIGIDLSKVIFILSYNDVSLMDKILLDRIKRIPFNALSSSEKLSICKSFFLPELLTMHGLVNKINISDTTLMHIIEVYTYESGCRKLKELLTQIVGMINLKMLESLCEETKSSNLSLPINVSVEDVDQIYLKLNPKIQNFPITNDLQTVGMVNCLYANDFGKGGVLKTTAKIIPASSFLELRLTGLLDGMMKESFEVSKTLAWDLLEENAKENFLNLYNSSSQKYGVHIHCGDGSISKSGTSAGVAITLLLYSIFNNKPISNRFAITGEVSLDGSVSEIGALEYKLLGGIKHGIKKFLFPSKNINDYHLFLETSQKENLNLESIQFFPIQTIQDAIKIIFY